MNITVIILGSFFALISSAILAYISMATPLGPWLAPTIVIFSGIIFRLMQKKNSEKSQHKELALIQTMGSVGGIIAMGIGFTLPMIFFLDPAFFASWMENPGYFCVIIAAACMSAGGLGIWLARSYADVLIKEEKLSFPVSDLIHKTIISQSSLAQAKQLCSGFSLSVFVTILRDGIFRFQGFFPKATYLFPAYFGKDLAFYVWPMVWSVGFIAGMGIVFPLVLGFISRYLVLYPLNHHGAYLPFQFFAPFSPMQFSMAFCSGIVFSGLILSWLKYPAVLWKKIKTSTGFSYLANKTKRKEGLKIFQEKIRTFFSGERMRNGKRAYLFSIFLQNIEPLVVVTACFLFLSYFKFNLVAQAAIILLTIIFSYQISYFSGSIGLVPFGRFTTFVMIPLFLLFHLDYLQLTILCVFTNICFATATDLLFDYKVGELVGLDFVQIRKYQWLGLIITSCGMGFFLWLLFTNFGIGTPELFAHRAKVRALMIQTLSFDIEPVFLGFIFGIILKKIRVNPMMVFGGILMPPVITIALALGAVFSWFDVKAKEHVPFWSGIFSGEATFITVALITKLFA